MRKFAAEQGIHNYDINEGVCHQVVQEHDDTLWIEDVLASHLGDLLTEMWQRYQGRRSGHDSS